jgi:hypothetical protein
MGFGENLRKSRLSREFSQFFDPFIEENWSSSC